LAADPHDTAATPGIDVLGALARHWFAFLAPIVLLVGVGVGLGLKRAPRYTATANLQVGHVFVSNPAGVSTVIEATQTLAGVYARAIHATAVQSDVAGRLRRARIRGAGGLSATALPSSPLIKVTGEATSAAAATAIANAGADALVAYVNHQVKATDATTTLTQRYRRAALAYRQAHAREIRLTRRYRENPSGRNKKAMDAAGAAADTALLDRQALRASYEQAVMGGAAAAAVESFSRARAAVSDRSETVQILAFLGLLGGLAAGVGFALLLASRDLRRRRPR
jgi:capsular polysaccharide biosynthesis protein